jgi:hypothetical protein
MVDEFDAVDGVGLAMPMAWRGSTRRGWRGVVAGDAAVLQCTACHGKYVSMASTSGPTKGSLGVLHFAPHLMASTSGLAGVWVPETGAETISRDATCMWRRGRAMSKPA